MCLVHGERSYIRYALAAGSVIKVGGQELKECRRRGFMHPVCSPFPTRVLEDPPLSSLLFSIPSSRLFISTSPAVPFMSSSTSPFPSSSSCHCPRTHTLSSFGFSSQTDQRQRAIPQTHKINGHHSSLPESGKENDTAVLAASTFLISKSFSIPASHLNFLGSGKFTDGRLKEDG